MEIIEGNKLIARFLGYQYYPKIGDEVFPGWRHSKAHLKMNSSYLGRNHKDLRFDSDWNRLMRTVSKIESTYDEFHGYFAVFISSNSCSIQGTKLNIEQKHYAYFNQCNQETKILAVWEAVVMFIIWYNENLAHK